MFQKLLQKFLSSSRLKQIAFAVFGIHFLIILGLSIHHLASYQSKTKRPISVRTRSFASPQPQQAPAAAPGTPIATSPSAKSPSSKSETKPIPSQVAIKPSPKPVAKSIAKPSAQTAPLKAKTEPRLPPSSNQLFDEISQNLEQIGAKEKTPNTKKSLSIPKLVPQKAEVAQDFPIDANYREMLISYLQNVLDLPEYGEVKARIELDRFGNLINCTILEAKSRKNADFLKNRLPELAFPCFNDFEISETTLNFKITFRNVEIR